MTRLPSERIWLNVPETSGKTKRIKKPGKGKPGRLRAGDKMLLKTKMGSHSKPEVEVGTPPPSFPPVHGARQHPEALADIPPSVAYSPSLGMSWGLC